MRRGGNRMIPGDPIDELYLRVAELEKEVKRLRNNTRPTVPLYSSGAFPDEAVNGQIAIDVTDGSGWAYYNGWKSFTDPLAIKYNVYPQEGGKLSLFATDDAGVGGAVVANIFIRSERNPTNWYEGAILVQAPSGALRVEAEHLYFDLGTPLTPNHGSIVYSHESHALDLGADELGLVGNSVVLLNAGTFQISITSAGLEIKDEVTSHLLFRIDADGSIHGKSSVGAITWDIP